jgi:hypothetical protein
MLDVRLAPPSAAVDSSWTGHVAIRERPALNTPRGSRIKVIDAHVATHQSHRKRRQARQVQPAGKALRGLRPAIHVAKKMGSRLGERAVLLRPLPRAEVKAQPPAYCCLD